jgi:hypothetical protein
VPPLDQPLLDSVPSGEHDPDAVYLTTAVEQLATQAPMIVTSCPSVMKGWTQLACGLGNGLA